MMFLAWKELMHSKRKFNLVILLVVLIAYMVYFLTSLAFGLATSYTNGINKINADYIVLGANANDNVMMSMLPNSLYDDVITTGEKAKLGLFPAVAADGELSGEALEASRVEIYVFGVENIQFFIPDDINMSLADGQVIVDSSMKKLGYMIGDEIMLSDNETFWTIVGFTEKATYQTAPIVYANLSTWQDYRFSGQPNTASYNAVMIKGNVSLGSSELTSYTIGDFIQTLPGYTAQVLTFSIMIGFLIVIVAFVLGIFIYVLTIQKVSMFGVMKAQGISNRYIAQSVLNQTLILIVIGAALGLMLTLVSGYFLRDIVPFAVNILFYSAISILFIVFSLLGGLFSVNTVVKIDPLRAIG